MGDEAKLKKETKQERIARVQQELDMTDFADRAVAIVTQGEDYKPGIYNDAGAQGSRNRDIKTAGIGFTLSKKIREYDKDTRQWQWAEKLPESRTRWQKAGITENFDDVLSGAETLSVKSAVQLVRVHVQEGIDFWRTRIENFDQMDERKRFALLDMHYQFGEKKLSTNEPFLSITQALQGGDSEKAGHLLADTERTSNAYGKGKHKGWVWWGERTARNAAWLADDVETPKKVEGTTRVWTVNETAIYAFVESRKTEGSTLPIFLNTQTKQECGAFPEDLFSKYLFMPRCDLPIKTDRLMVQDTPGITPPPTTPKNPQPASPTKGI